MKELWQADPNQPDSAGSLAPLLFLKIRSGVGKIVKMPRYSSDRKEAIQKKMLPARSITIAALAKQQGIAEQTL